MDASATPTSGLAIGIETKRKREMTTKERAYNIIGELYTMDGRYRKEDVIGMMVRIAEEQEEQDFERLIRALDLLRDRALEWAEQQNFSASVKLDLKRFLEE